MWTIKQNERNQNEGIKDKAEIDWSRENNKINNKTITWHFKKRVILVLGRKLKINIKKKVKLIMYRDMNM